MPPSGIRCDRVAERSRCYRLAVRTKDSQSLNRGSIPRSTTKKSLSRLFFCYIGDRTPGFSATAFCRLLLTEQFSIPRSTTKKSLSRLFFLLCQLSLVFRTVVSKTPIRACRRTGQITQSVGHLCGAEIRIGSRNGRGYSFYYEQDQCIEGDLFNFHRSLNDLLFVVQRYDTFLNYANNSPK